LDHTKIYRRIIPPSCTCLRNCDRRRRKKIAVKKYYRRAKELERWIPIARPPPEYIIDMSDLNDRLRKELLDEITSNDARQDVIKEAVGRIFENLNLERYHLSIARNLKVRLV
jgi:hypothetical protein